MSTTADTVCECEHDRGQHDAIGNCWHVDAAGDEDCDCDQFRPPVTAVDGAGTPTGEDVTGRLTAYGSVCSEGCARDLIREHEGGIHRPDTASRRTRR